MKVASYLTLRNVDMDLFQLWLDTLPIRLSNQHRFKLLKRSVGRKAVIWMNRGGFRFFD